MITTEDTVLLEEPAAVCEPVLVIVAVCPLTRLDAVPPDVLVSAEPSYVLEALAAVTVVALLLTVNVPTAFVIV